jgi:hypothetical protein
MFGTRSEASSPSIQERRSLASRMVPKLPLYCGTVSLPPSLNLTR